MEALTATPKPLTLTPRSRVGLGAVARRGWLWMLFLSMFSISGVCQSSANAPASGRDLRTLQKEIADLKAQIEVLRKAQQADSETIRNLTHASVFLDTSSPKVYQRVETEIGTLLISLGEITPDRTGFKVNVNIGVPLAVAINGLVLNARWGSHRPQDKTDLAAWLNSSKAKTFSLRNTLYEGKWNRVSITIPESDPSRFKSIEVSIHLNSITLQ